MNRSNQSGARSASVSSFSRGPKRGFSARPANGGSKGGFSKSSSGNSFGGGRARSFNRPSFNKPKSRGRGASSIDHNLFINKAKIEHVTEYLPQNTFKTFGLDEKIVANLTTKGYKVPSAIQDQSIPVIMAGNDIVGIANTGTGKTAAFLLPLIHKVSQSPRQKVMVLAPTRELAQQIEVEFRDFTFGMKMFSVSAVGGLPIGRQMSQIERGVSFVIGTPGRVKDLINRGKINMKDFGYIVLDEADRMLDMGFVDDMRLILSQMKSDKQALFFSATMPSVIKTLCNEFLKNPVNVSVKTRDTAGSVDQDVVRIRHKSERIEVLHELLEKPGFTKVLIFREMKRQVDELQKELRVRGFNVVALHGDMQARQRMNSVKALTSGEATILIATDVAARGIDISGITHVINYDVPRDYETYIHRVGRTGRGSAKGQALTFI